MAGTTWTCFCQAKLFQFPHGNSLALPTKESIFLPGEVWERIPHLWAAVTPVTVPCPQSRFLFKPTSVSAKNQHFTAFAAALCLCNNPSVSQTVCDVILSGTLVVSKAECQHVAGPLSLSPSLCSRWKLALLFLTCPRVNVTSLERKAEDPQLRTVQEKAIYG